MATSCWNNLQQFCFKLEQITVRSIQYQTWYDTTQRNTTQHSAVQRNATQHNTTQHNTTQHNTTQHNTTQHNTTQHNALQCNTMQFPQTIINAWSIVSRCILSSTKINKPCKCLEEASLSRLLQQLLDFYLLKFKPT
jgi:hypothetical protein